MTEPLTLFDALERVRVPADVSLAPDHSVVAFCAPGRPDPAASVAIHLVGLAIGGHRTIEPPSGYRYAFTRFDPDTATLVAACGVADGELESVVEVDTETGAHATEVAVDGAIEDLVALGGGRWLVRIAEPGSERDGMHLGTRVQAISGPTVLSHEGAWRRLVSVDLTTGTTTDHPTPGWTIWDVDAGRDAAGRVVAVAVASREPSPAGYYAPALLRVPLSDPGGASGTPTGVAAADGIELLLETERQLARPRLDCDGGAVLVVEGRSIVAGPVRRLDLATGDHQVIDTPGDTTDLACRSGRWWTAGWSDRGSVVAVGSLDAPDHVVRLEATIHGRDAQPSVVPLDEHRCLAVVDSPDRPAELCIIDMATGDVQALTRLNVDVTAGIDPATDESLAWPSGDHEIRGGLVRAQHGEGPRPLVVFLHGGPTWLWPAAYSPAESNQLALPVAAAGAHVLLPNPRGSSGRGLAFADAIAGHVGEIDVDDVLAGVDHLVERGLVDPRRVAVIGTSYGGYLATWLAANSPRIRCAVAFSLVADWNSFALTSAIGGGFDRIYFPDADPCTADGRDELARRSPVHHGDGGVAPLLVVHGDADRITPIGQADAIRHAWRRAGGHVDVVIYPGEGHELAVPRHRRDAARRALAFLHDHGILE